MRRTFSIHIVNAIKTCSVFAVLCAIATTVVAADWQAGLAKAVITPDNPTWMAGYASRNRPADGTINDLYAKALSLRSANGETFVLVTMDLISIPFPLRHFLEDHVHQQHSLPASALMLNCSHTHCGPEIRTSRWALDGLEPNRLKLAEQYVASLKKKLTTTIDLALERLEPSKLVYVRSRCGFGMNRRTPSNGGFRNFPNPDGPVDHDVPVLKIEDPDGKTKGIVFGYACHNTTLGIYQFCGDYAGFAQQYLEETHKDAIAMFVLGCGADINPYPRGTVELAQTHGKSLATAVEAALQTTPLVLKPHLDHKYGKALLEYSTAPTKAELIERSESSNQYIAAHGKRLLKQLEQVGQLRTNYEAPVQVIKLGNALTLIALPGETCVDYSLRLKAELSDETSRGRIWVAGYSNDVFAYIPSRRVLLEGGYEAGDSMKYFTTVLQHGPFAPNVEERLIYQVHRLLDE